MIRLSVIAGLALATVLPRVAEGGVAAKCRKACKPAVAECRQITGQSKRACRRSVIPVCKRLGVQVCALTTSTTTPTAGEPTTTSTTTPGPGSGGGGVMFMSIEAVDVQAGADPAVYAVTISIEYGIVTADAVPQVALDAAAFTIRDEDTSAVYPPEPPAEPGDCSAALVVAKEDPPVTCTLRFLMPAAVGAPSQIDGGVHALLEFESSGLHASRYLD